MRLGVEQRGATSGGRGPTQTPPRQGTSGGLGRMRRAGMLSSGRLAVRRLTRGWELLLAVGIGMLAAVILVCTVPLYDTLIADVQLQRTISADSPPERNIAAQAQSSSVSASLRQQATSQVQALANHYLSGFVSSASTYYVVSDDTLLIQAGQHTYDPASNTVSRVDYEAFDYTAAAPHMRILAGALPQTSAGTAQPQVIVTKEMADEQMLKVGNSLTVTQFGDHTQRLTARVVGIWTPKNADDPYWNGHHFDAHFSPDAPAIYPVLTTYQDFFSRLSSFTQIGMTQSWVYYTQPGNITTGNMNSVQQNIGQFRSRINGNLLAISGISKAAVLGTLNQDIKDVQQQLTLLALPLYVIVAQVVGLALLFVTAMAGLLIDGQSQDIATLKSRGASDTQLLSSFTFQGLLLAIIAAIAGPFLAALLGMALVHWFVPAGALQITGVGANYLTRLANPRAVIVPALIGAALSVAAVAFSAFQSARMDVLAFRREQGRASRAPFWKRYYLDVALAVLCLIGYLELGQFGSIGTRAQISGGGASPLLLVTPALLLLAGALIVLRVLPLGAGLGARLASRGRGLISLLALSQVERSPGRYSRITLLLVLAVGLGLFAITFDASLLQNVHDQTTYSIGADVRVVENTGLGNGSGQVVQRRLAALPGVAGVTPIYRTLSGTTIDQGSIQVDTLAIDPATFASVAGTTSWRADYADQPLNALLAQMRANTHGATAGSGQAPVWALVSQEFATQFHIHAGSTFALQLSEGGSFSSTIFVVGGIVNEFPTLYPNHQQGSFIVVNINDFINAAIASAPGQDTSALGPNEFLLKMQHDAAPSQAFITALNKPELQVQKYQLLSSALNTAQANPVSAGIRGLLLVGAITAVLLAVLGSAIQSLLAARQRSTQFAVLRTVGMTGSQLTRLLLGEQVVMYFFGLVGGTVLGLLLTTATLPFLQFSDTTVDASTLGVPSYVLTFNGDGILLFYAALLFAFVLALALAARYASTIGLGKALRLGED